jgi:uncharacterized protein
MSDFEWGAINTKQVELAKDVEIKPVESFGEFLQKQSEKFEKLQKDAESGDAVAQLQLSLNYSWGIGVIKDDNKAFEWCQKAATHGDAHAQFFLGIMYFHGDGVAKDDVKALEWYQKAAEQGNAQAQTNIARRYIDGNVVPKDDVKAVMWLQKAAEQGLAQAQGNLGIMYANGEGVTKDDVKSFKWYQKAAIQGDAASQINLSYRYKVGIGVSKDIVLAYAWANLAAAQGEATAHSNRDLYEKQLSNAERMEGQRLASNWKKGDNLLSSNSNYFDKYDEVPPNNKPNKQGASTDQWAELDSYSIKESKLTKQATGTAFTVSSEGHAVTNHHVINGCAEVIVSGLEGLVKVITSDSVNDLALLQLPGQIDSYAKLNPDTRKLRQGEDIIVFGYPLNFALSSGGNLTLGILSALTGLGNNTNHIQITAPVQPGSSGSPVMDKKGNVIAVVSITLDDGKITKITGQVGQNVNFAVNGQTVKAFLDANKVPYKTGGGFFSTEKNNADIADEAHKWTVLVECWK